ncbi:response regulator [Bdellovibrionota bacterium FG-2]
MDRIKVLVIDDEEPVRKGLMKLLALDEYEVFGAENGIMGMEIFKQASPDVVVTDIRMPKMDGIEVLKSIKESFPSTLVFIITGHGEDIACDSFLKLGAADFFEKLVDYERLIISINRGLKGLESLVTRAATAP